MKEKMQAVAILCSPWATIVLIWVAFAYLAPCGCMGGCSPQNTPNRCITSGGASRG